MNIRIGVSYQDETSAAIREASAQIDSSADLLWLFISSRHNPDIVASELSKTFPDIPVVGCSTSGELSPEGYAVNSCVMVSIQSATHRFSLAALDDIRGKEQESGFLCAQKAFAQLNVSEPKGVFVLLSNGTAPNQHDIVRGAYAFCGAGIPIVGGVAAYDSTSLQCFQIANRQVLHQGLVGLWIYTEEPYGIGVRHGWTPKSRLLRVTDASGSMIHELDGRPALDVYCEVLGLTEEHLIQARLATLCAQHPLGMVSSDQQYEVRHILRRENQSLVCFGNVRDGSLIAVMSTTPEQLVQAGADAFKDAMSMKGPTAPSLGILFSCLARSWFLGERVPEEWQNIHQVADTVPICGFYTHGEFARFNGRVGFYNGTVVSLVL